MNSEQSFSEKLLALISEPSFIKYQSILREPNIFKIVGRTHFERWHSAFFGWLLDYNGSHLLYDYVLTRFLLLIHDKKCLKPFDHHNNSLTRELSSISFTNIEVTPNENLATEVNVRNVGRFDIYLTSEFINRNKLRKKLNIIFEFKIDGSINAEQSKRYADWLHSYHPQDLNLLIYILPKLLSDSKSTVGDSRWYCMNYQLLNDKLLLPILDHPNLNQKTIPFIIQYIKNLKINYNGIKMAITNEEKKMAIELYEKYRDVFDSIYDALEEENIVESSTSEIPSRGRKTGKMAVKIDNKVFEGEMVRTLFSNVLKYLVDKKYVNQIPLPWGVGDKRYILSNEDIPKHPNGRDFFYPETYKGYTIETHYGRDRAIAVLNSLCAKLNIEYEPVDV